MKLYTSNRARAKAEAVFNKALAKNKKWIEFGHGLNVRKMAKIKVLLSMKKRVLPNCILLGDTADVLKYDLNTGDVTAINLNTGDITEVLGVEDSYLIAPIPHTNFESKNSIRIGKHIVACVCLGMFDGLTDKEIIDIEVNHKDFEKFNNKPINLELVSGKDNKNHYKASILLGKDFISGKSAIEAVNILKNGGYALC